MIYLSYLTLLILSFSLGNTKVVNATISLCGPWELGKRSASILRNDVKRLQMPENLLKF